MARMVEKEVRFGHKRPEYQGGGFTQVLGSHQRRTSIERHVFILETCFQNLLVQQVQQKQVLHLHVVLQNQKSVGLLS